MKRSFISHVSCEKEFEIKKKKKKKGVYNVEDVLSSCYVNTIKEMVENEAVKQCNGCICSFHEKTVLYYPVVISKLMGNNDAVIKKFEETVEITPELYNFQDVVNARNMMKCKAHREQLCIDNRIFFKDIILKHFS